MYSDVKDNIENHVNLFAIRDPLYRPIAMYNEVMKLRRDAPYRHTEKTKFYQQRNNLFLSFELFLEEIKNCFYDHHTDPQYEALTKKSLSLWDMDYIFLIEKLNYDLSLFCEKNHISYKPTQANETPKPRKNLLKSYIDKNPVIQQMIRQIWEQDFLFYEEALRVREVINPRYLELNN